MMKILITVLSAILITAAVIFAAFVAVSAKIFGKGKPYDTERAMKRRPELLERVRAGRKALENITLRRCSSPHTTGLSSARTYTRAGSTAGGSFSVCTATIPGR